MDHPLKDLKQRLPIACAIIVILAILITFSFMQWVGWILAVLVSSLAGIGTWEYGKMVEKKGLTPSLRSMSVISSMQVLGFYLSLSSLNNSGFFLFFMFFALLFIVIKHFKEQSNSLLHIATELFGICYVALPLILMLAVLYPSLSMDVVQEVRYWLLYLIAVTKIADVGGYFIGKIWGKKPLAVHLSPNKTIEGAFGGFLFSVLLSICFALCSKAGWFSYFTLTIPKAIFLGAIIGVLAQIGDLVESLFKRDAGIKDSNKIPGIGGVLDMLDSFLFTAPIVYLFLRFYVK